MSWRKRATLCGLRERPRARGPRHSPGSGQAARLRAVTIARTSPGRPPSPHRPHVRPPHPCEQPWLRERQTQRLTQRPAGRRPGAAEAAVSRPGSRSQPPPPRSPCGISWCAAHPGSVLQARSQEPPYTHAHTGRRTFTSTHLHTPNTTHTNTRHIHIRARAHQMPHTLMHACVYTSAHTTHHPHTPCSQHTHHTHTHTCIHTRTHHTPHTYTCTHTPAHTKCHTHHTHLPAPHTHASQALLALGCPAHSGRPVPGARDPSRVSPEGRGAACPSSVCGSAASVGLPSERSRACSVAWSWWLAS